MKKKIVISTGSIVIFVIGLVFFLSTGGERTDVILTHYSLSEDNKVMTLHINVAGSMGYVRGLKENKVVIISTLLFTPHMV